jgi:hypothetical protein
MGVYLIGVYLMSMYLISVNLISVYHIDMHLPEVVPTVRPKISIVTFALRTPPYYDCHLQLKRAESCETALFTILCTCHVAFKVRVVAVTVTQYGSRTRSKHGPQRRLSSPSPEQKLRSMSSGQTSMRRPSELPAGLRNQPSWLSPER